MVTERKRKLEALLVLSFKLFSVAKQFIPSWRRPVVTYLSVTTHKSAARVGRAISVRWNGESAVQGMQFVNCYRKFASYVPIVSTRLSTILMAFTNVELSSVLNKEANLRGIRNYLRYSVIKHICIDTVIMCRYWFESTQMITYM